MMKPICRFIDFETGKIGSKAKITKRYLSDLEGVFRDIDALRSVFNRDILVYEVHEIVVPERAGEITHGTSIIYPGKVGDEYFMTKGHFHVRAGGEVYLCLKGEGYILMEEKGGRSSYSKMIPGSLVYVPPLWAHRTINTGTKEFTCFYAFPSEVGHDYETIEKKGFSKLFLERDGKPVIENAHRDHQDSFLG